MTATQAGTAIKPEPDIKATRIFTTYSRQFKKT